ncbi:MAG: hypothetical protein ACEQSN_17730, partial [Yersinia sp. (in: enterobacteria)]
MAIPSPRENTAKGLGFTNFGEFYFDAYDNYLRSGRNWSKAAAVYGKHKGYVRTVLRGFDMEKAKVEVERGGFQAQLRGLVADNCSLVKACEILGIELPAGRVLLGEYVESREFKVAWDQGKTKRELELEITKRLLD